MRSFESTRIVLFAVCPARPAVARVAAGRSKPVFLCTDCDGRCDGNVRVPIEGFSDYPAAAELAVSRSLNLLPDSGGVARGGCGFGARGAAGERPSLAARSERAWRRAAKLKPA
jgi:hypothetical protein